MASPKFSDRYAVEKASYTRVKEEVYRVSNFEGFRSQPASPLEIGLGFLAFLEWTLKGMAIRNSRHADGIDDAAWNIAMQYHFEVPNESARNVAVQFVERLGTNPTVVSAIRRKIPSFEPEQEVALALAKVSKADPQWGPCLTRAVIMGCRSLAYEATGIMGGSLDLPKTLTVRDLGLVGYHLMAEALDEEGAAIIMSLFEP